MRKNSFTLKKCLNMFTDDGFVEFIIENNGFSKNFKKSTNPKRKGDNNSSEIKKDFNKNPLSL